MQNREPLQLPDFGALRKVVGREAEALVDERRAEGARALDVGTLGGKLGGDVDGDEPAEKSSISTCSQGDGQGERVDAPCDRC